ncbi:MAG: D-alanine--D-alanine ligase [Micrococcales bacterium]|nr:D-alanine--D-alanine ligase [Micrococcales bacterium]
MTATNPKVRVAVLFGGRSGEHSISCVTAGGLLAAIDRDRFEPVPIGITQAGRLTLTVDDPDLYRLGRDELPTVDPTGPEVILPQQAGSREWRLVSDDGAEPCLESLGQIDVAFPLLHGPYGEDGTIQGCLELLDVAYVGPGVLASALGMDKAHMKEVFASNGLPVAPGVVVTPLDWRDDRAGIMAKVAALGYPVFVKPCRAGSSLGITKVAAASELELAVEVAAKEDPKVLVEPAQAGRELECAVLGGRGGAAPRAAGPAEVVVRPGHDFYSFVAKYIDAEAVELCCPADLPASVARRVGELAVRAFAAIDAEGLSRVDFFYDQTKPAGQDLVINEINTMPGMTPISLYPRMWAAAGLDYTTLISELIDLALERRLGLR